MPSPTTARGRSSSGWRRNKTAGTRSRSGTTESGCPGRSTWPRPRRSASSSSECLSSRSGAKSGSRPGRGFRSRSRFPTVPSSRRPDERRIFSFGSRAEIRSGGNPGRHPRRDKGGIGRRGRRFLGRSPSKSMKGKIRRLLSSRGISAGDDELSAARLLPPGNPSGIQKRTDGLFPAQGQDEYSRWSGARLR